MEIFGLGQPKKRKRGQRGPTRSGPDRLAAQKARAIEMALKKRPELAERIALGELGIGDDVDPFDRFMEHLGKFRAIMPDVREVDRGPGIDWAQLGAGIASALGPVLVNLMQAGAPPAVVVAPPAQLPSGGPSAAPGAAPAAAVGGGSPPAAADRGPVAERRRTDEIAGRAAWQSTMAVGMLSGLTPAEAAAVLGGVTQFGVPDVLAWLVRVPDAEVIAYLARVGEKQPHLAGLVSWCAADPEWTVEVVRELRALRGVAAPEAAA